MYIQFEEREVCMYNIFLVLINLYMNSGLNGFHDLMVHTIILFQSPQENIIEIKTVSKSAP